MAFGEGKRRFALGVWPGLLCRLLLSLGLWADQSEVFDHRLVKVVSKNDFQIWPEQGITHNPAYKL